MNISGDKIIEKIEEYINNLEGNGIIVTIYVSEEKTEKISITLPNENKLDIQFLEDTEKENTIEFTYLYKNSEYKSGISINIDEVHNSASSSIKIVKNYIENEKVNKKESLAIQSNGTQNSNTISSDIIVTFSTNNSETKFVADSKLKFLSNNYLLLDKLTEENSVFLDDLLIDDRNATVKEERAVVVIDVYTFIIDREFNISDT